MPLFAVAYRRGGGTEMLIAFLYSIACSRGWRMVANGAVYINTNRWPAQVRLHQPGEAESLLPSAGYLDLNNLNKGIQQSRYGY